MTSFPPSRGRCSPKDKTPSFPTQQLFVLALCRICEPIAFMSIFPYIYYMISSFEITSDQRQIVIYAGAVTSAFAFAEFSSGVIWGRLSDRIGRKPVLLGGLAGTALSMIVFGFSTSLPMALVGRALGGLLNGNIGVLQTTVAELVKVKEHQPRAYSIMPFVWCLGSILGPALGGALAQPCLNYPSIFAKGTIFDRYPFLLPNLVCTIILVFGVIIGVLFLEETHEGRKYKRDVGLEIGQWILKRIKSPGNRISISDKAAEAENEETLSLIEDDLPPGYMTTEGSPRYPSSRTPSLVKDERRKGLRAAQKAFTKQVIMNIVGYGILAYHTISFDQLMPIFLSSPISHEAPSLPFKFTGGFELSSRTIGIMLSIQGLYSMTAQVFLFPFVVKRFGSLKTFRFVVISWPALYLLVPYLVFLPTNLQMTGILFCLLWRITAQVLSFPSNAILLTNSAPSLTVLGMINGVAASVASLSRAFGPTFSGLIASFGESKGYTGFAWWAGGLVAIVGALESLWMEEGKGRMDSSEANDSEDEEAPETEPYLNPLAVDAAINASTAPLEDEPSTGS